jgi:hypothetical protein
MIPPAISPVADTINIAMAFPHAVRISSTATAMGGNAASAEFCFLSFIAVLVLDSLISAND